MSFDLPGEINPFEAPRTRVGEEALYLEVADDNDERIRRENIGHEASLKSLGYLNYLIASLWAFFVVFAVLMATGVIVLPNQRGGTDPTLQRVIMGAGALFYLVLASINGALGYGLTHFQVWARWTALVCTILALLYLGLMTAFAFLAFSVTAGVAFLTIGGGILGYALYLLVISKSGVVFSPEYREIIRKTPHVKNRTSPVAKIVLVLLLAAALIFVVVLFSGGNG